LPDFFVTDPFARLGKFFSQGSQSNDSACIPLSTVRIRSNRNQLCHNPADIKLSLGENERVFSFFIFPSQNHLPARLYFRNNERMTQDLQPSQSTRPNPDDVVRNHAATVFAVCLAGCRSLRKLPEEYREALSLYYLDGRNGAEVARLLELSEPAVRKRLARGRLMLHDLIMEDTL